jgi:hypothetical protein
MWCFGLELPKNIPFIGNTKMACSFDYYSLANFSTTNKVCMSVQIETMRMCDYYVPSQPDEFTELLRNCICTESASETLAKLQERRG